MPSQEPISAGQIKPESCREPQTSLRLQQTNVNLQAPPKCAESYTKRPLGDFETAHGPALVLQIGQRLQTVFGLESIQASLGLAELGIQGGPSRVGNFAGGVIGHRGVLDQRVKTESRHKG